MARENQGLQIALIVFVMLTIILGVTTYLFFRQYEEADIKAKSNLAERDKATKLALQNEDAANELKRMLGIAKTEKVETITSTMFAEDMKNYGGSYPEEVRFYRPLMERMAKTIDEKNVELKEAKDQVAKLEADFAVREANKQPQLDDFKKAAQKASQDLDSERDKFKSDRDRITKDLSALKGNLEEERKKAAASLSEIDQKLAETTNQLGKLKNVNKALTDEKQQLVATKFETPSGEIRWVNQRTGTAWINLGKADDLFPQVTFGVYPADISDISAGKKGNIEVTKILGDHLAEVRVFDDKLLDPIVPGDKIYTPVWVPGEKRHFAFAGFTNMGGNIQNDVEFIKDLVTMNGGVVDCYLDNQGKRVGDMTVKTRYLILGDPPSEKSQSEVLEAFTTMRKDAERLGAQTIQLNDLLNRMGWKNTNAVLPYGESAKSKDVLVKPVKEQAKAAADGEGFQRREPPARVPTSAF